MLKVRAGVSDRTITYIDSYFRNNYEDEWLADMLVKKMVVDIDDSEIISAHKVWSPVLGDISPLDLSTGVKALILMYKEPKNEFWATACGDNCSHWIRKFGEELGITISLEHFMNFGDNHFLCEDAETGKIMEYYEFVMEKL